VTGSPVAPRISVVLAAFNAARTVSSAVRSVLAQTERGFELIVVDDGSTDSTLQILDDIGDPRMRVISQANRGPSAARNTGIDAARGGLIAFLDADDLWLPRYLERMGAALDARPDAGMAYCDAWVFEDGTGRVRRTTIFDRHHPPGPPPLDPAQFLVLHLRDNFFYVGTTVRARALAQVGGFREDLTGREDYEMWLRIEADGFPVVEVAEPLALYRISPHQRSANSTHAVTGNLELYDILQARRDLPPQAYRILARRRQAMYRSLTPPSPGTVLRARARRLASDVWHALPGAHVWRDQPPPAVADAFPDLATL
jgi:glycosyltransferase involved in cell wall biosynthesis